MNIDDLTFGQIKEIGGMCGAVKSDKPTPFEIGKAYLIRTVTMAWTGRVSRIVGNFLVLTEAAWIADTGRFNEVLKAGNAAEIEPVPGDAFIAITSIVDALPWDNALPREVT